MQPIGNIDVFSPFTPGIFSLVIFSTIIIVQVAVMLFLAGFIGAKKPGREKARVYESGIIPTGTAQIRYPVPFFLVAVFFLIFDVEGAFIFSWAVAAKSLGWIGWFRITFFILVLIAGLVYIWLKGGLDWGPASKNE